MRHQKVNKQNMKVNRASYSRSAAPYYFFFLFVPVKLCSWFYMCFLCAGLKGCGNDSDWKVTDLRLGSSPCHLGTQKVVLLALELGIYFFCLVKVLH